MPLDADADRLQRLGRGRHVVPDAAAQDAFGGPEEQAAAQRIRFQEPLPPRPQRQTGERSFALAEAAAGQLGELIAQLRFRRQGVGQPQRKRLHGIQPFALQDHSQAPLQADDARQPLRAAPAGQQTQLTSGRPSCVFGLSKTSR